MTATGEPPRTAGERESLVAFLDHHRAILARKCQDLTDEQLRDKAIAPSGLCLLGLVRHLAEVERSWFQVVWRGERTPPHWPGTVNGTYAEFDAAEADVGEALAVWRGACERSRAIVSDAPSLDDTVSFQGEIYSLRYVLLHLIEEYARHNGHADLLRERLDGATGE